MVEAYAGRTGAYYSLCSGWILGQGRPKIQTVRNGALGFFVKRVGWGDLISPYFVFFVYSW